MRISDWSSDVCSSDLDEVKRLDPTIFTKSGIMVGLGEGRAEVLQVMDDLRSAEVDFLTIGQYLQPTPKHHVVDRFVPPEEFKQYEALAYNKGFLMVSASPPPRSSDRKRVVSGNSGSVRANLGGP